MQNYSPLSKAIHRFYLNNYFLSRATFNFEIEKYYKQAENLQINKILFISGLARAGTTAFMRDVYNTEKYASLQYHNMPYLLMPNTLKLKNKINSSERAHMDGIMINEDSPEEFDEYFWKVFLKNKYIKKTQLISHALDKQILDKYLKYIKLICLSKNKENYITKNNNNILRIQSLKKIDKAKFIFMVRDPLDHASSLMKLHSKFIHDQRNNPFILEYFNFLGHHEFGLNHKPFNLDHQNLEILKNNSDQTIEYWLIIWRNYHEYLLSVLDNKINLVFFKDFVSKNQKLLEFIKTQIEPSFSFNNKKHVPTKYLKTKSKVLEECYSIYFSLLKKINY